MLARTARVATTTARTSVLSNQAVAGRRFTAIDTRGGKSKLVRVLTIHVHPPTLLSAFMLTVRSTGSA